MAYNHGKAERRWRLWKEKEEKILRECGVDEETIEEIRTFDREEFNSDRRFYTRLNDVGEYIAETAMQEPPMEVNTVWDMLNGIIPHFTLKNKKCACKLSVTIFP